MIKKKSLGYFEYDPVIYPRKLWVHIGEDFKELTSKAFCNIEVGDIKEYYGVEYGEVSRKSDGMYGMVVSFHKRKDITRKLCAHEASHVCDDLEEAIGMKHGGEASAYLLGWIADCFDKARLGVGDFIEIKDKEE